MPAQSHHPKRHGHSPVKRWAATSVLGLLGAGAVLAGGAGPAVAASTDPDFELPFACGEDWSASTRSGHSPSFWSVDFNAYDDFRHPVLASTSGVVTSAVNLGSSSYGQYVVVDHGGNWTTLYAHLDEMLVTPGQWVDQGHMIALVGTSGGSTGPHLHFEERLNRVDQHAVFHDVPLQYNTTVRSRSCPDVPVSGDWNGNRTSNVAIWRRSASGGVFSLRQPDGTATKVPWGENVDSPVTGDWNGDGVTDVGVWQRLTHTFVLRTPSGSARIIELGSRRGLPLTGDWDGNGRTDVGTFSPRRGVFTLRGANGAITRITFGSASSLPVTGDWNGDGRTDVGLYDPASGTWSLRAADGSVTKTVFGGGGRLPVTGDWDGDGDTEIGSWSPVTATFSLRGNRIRTVAWGHRRG